MIYFCFVKISYLCSQKLGLSVSLSLSLTPSLSSLCFSLSLFFLVLPRLHWIIHNPPPPPSLCKEGGEQRPGVVFLFMQREPVLLCGCRWDSKPSRTSAGRGTMFGLIFYLPDSLFAQSNSTLGHSLNRRPSFEKNSTSETHTAPRNTLSIYNQISVNTDDFP